MTDPDKLEEYMIQFHLELVTFVRKEYPEFNCAFKADWSTRRTYSRGGWYVKGPGVSYAMQRLVRSIERNYFSEYASFINDSVIGSFDSSDWKIICKAISCHEIAHAVISFKDKNNSERHGNRWRHYYALLRQKFVNPFVDKIGNGSIVTTQRAASFAEIEPLVIDDKADFIAYGRKYGFTEKHFGQTFQFNKHAYKITGWNPRARKYFVKISRIPDLKAFVVEPTRIKNRLQAEGKWNI